VLRIAFLLSGVCFIGALLATRLERQAATTDV
jgi:hypothetical protein